MLTYAWISKPVFVAEMRAHRAADRIVQGRYWAAGRGCAVGCGIETLIRKGVVLGGASHFNHALLARAVTGAPWLSLLQERIFEDLPPGSAKDWPVRFAEALPEAVDPEPALGRILSRILREVVLPVAGMAGPVVERVARGWETGWCDDDPSEARAAAEMVSARAWVASAALAAARAAASAASAEAWELTADIVTDSLVALPM